MCDASDVTLTDVERLVSEPKLARWWSQPGFKEWFRNQEEFREKAELMAFLAMDAMESILISDDPRMAGPKAAMIKLAMEIASKMPTKNTGPEKYADAKIGDMDRKQLEEYIAKHVKLLPSTSP